MKLIEAITEDRIREIGPYRTIGIDIGSRSAKGVLLDDQNIYTAIIPTGFFMQKTAQELMQKLFKQSGLTISDLDYMVGTGYGRIAFKFSEIPMQIVTEIACHGMGAHFLGDDIETIIDIGGQDSKAIRIDPVDGKVIDFVMNDKCAAGTGRFLEKIANVLGYDVKDIGPASLEADEEVEMSSLCVVFAESEVISLRAKGEKAQNIAMGVNVSVARRMRNLLKRVGISGNVLFTGGVSNNVGMRKALEDTVDIKIQTAKIDTVFAGALGAAVFGQKYAKEGAVSTETGDSGFTLDLNSFRNAVDKRKENLIRKSTGHKKNVGYMCSYTPQELLNAADVAPVRLMHSGTTAEIAAGERMTRSVYCDFLKSVLGAFEEENPLYASVDKVYSFYTCDCVKKSMEAIDTRYVPATTFNIPRSRTNPNGYEYYVTEMKAFHRDLEKFTGQTIPEEKVREQIKLYNRVKAMYREISDFRKRSVPPIKGSEFEELALGYYYLPPEELLEQLEQIRDQLASSKEVQGKPLKLMLAGGILAEGDKRIAKIIESQSDVYIVAEDNCTGLKPFLTDVPEDPDTDIFENIAKGYLGKAPCARMQKIEDNVKLAVDIAKDYQVDGVVYYFLNFCPGYGIAKNKFVKGFQKAGIPVLEITGDFASNDEGQLKTRVEAFLEILREARNG